MLILPIRDVEPATPRALIVRLALEGHVFDYQAGQSVLVGQTDDGTARPYSIAAAPRESRATGKLELLVGLDAAGNAGPQWGALRPGQPMQVEGPLGSFHLPPGALEHDLLFVAGGTGIAPLRAMLHEAIGRRGQPRISVVYSARTADDFAYGAELRDLASRGRIRLWQTVTREPTTAWTGERGRIALHHLQALVQDAGTLCFVCGPHALVEEVPRLLAQAGIERDRIRIEDWGGG
jgi:Na+-transporting NADH:ubiquinone oxidoreductase subunit F